MEEIRIIKPEEQDMAIQLADRVFRDKEHKSMGLAYPNVFSSSLGQSYGMFVDGKLVSFVGLVPVVVIIEAAELNVYSIGAVCTDVDYRGRGYIEAILHRIREHTHQAGASLLLVSGNRGLYERFGCRPFGDVTTFQLKAPEAEQMIGAVQTEGIRIHEFMPSDWFNLKRLAQERPIRFEQSLWDLALLIQAEANASNGKLRHLVLMAERNHRIESYVVLAVPGDAIPKGIPSLIEWGGNSQSAAMLAAHGAIAAGIETLEIAVPYYETDFADQFAKAGCAAQQAKLSGTVAIVNSEALMQQLRPYLEKRDPAAFHSLRVNPLANGTYSIGWADRKYELTCSSFISLLFDNAPSDEIPTELRKAVQTLFPVPFPLPSGLNFV